VNGWLSATARATNFESGSWPSRLREVTAKFELRNVLEVSSASLPKEEVKNLCADYKISPQEFFFPLNILSSPTFFGKLKGRLEQSSASQNIFRLSNNNYATLR